MYKVGILICSCDYYKECWEPIIYSFDKYWPNCEYKKYIVSNFADATLPNTEIIKVGEHKGWASDTLKAVGQIDCDYLIYFQEDYFLNKPVDNDAIKAHVEHCFREKVDYLKIEPDAPVRDKYRIGDSDYCSNPPDQRYAINTAIAIWSKSLFSKICIPGQTGWDFERKINPYVRKQFPELKSEMLHTSVIVSKGITTITSNAIVRGKWTKAGVEFLKENGFEHLISNRPQMGKFYTWLDGITPHHNKYLRIPFWAVLKLLNFFHLN